MYTDIPTATRCCFCAPMRYGLLVWAYIKLISSIITLGGLLLWMSVFVFVIFFGGDTVFLITLLIMTTLILLFDVVFNFVFVIGVHKRNTTLLRLYCRYGIAYVIALIIYFLLIAGYVLASADSIFDDGHLWHSIGVVASAVGTTLILHSYLLVLIRSEIQKLKGNAQFKFENHAAEPKCFMQPITDVTDTDKKLRHRMDLFYEHTSSINVYVYYYFYTGLITYMNEDRFLKRRQTIVPVNFDDGTKKIKLDKKMRLKKSNETHARRGTDSAL